MSKFHSTFYSIGNRTDFTPQAWKKYFVSSKVDQWDQEQGGSIQYFQDDGEQYSLVMNYKNGEGISFFYDRYSKHDFSRNFSLISWASTKPMIGFECLKNGATIPSGSCISIEDSWFVVEDFLNNPKMQPPSVKWVNTKDLEWPESY